MPLAALGPILMGAAGTSAAATAGAWGAIGAGAGIAGNLVGASKTAGAAKDAAKLQTDAANHAADLQSKSTAEALAFQKQQAENEWLNSQNTQRANYDQSKARYGSIAGVASQYGLNLGAMPDFAGGIDPHYDTGASPLPSGSTTPNTTGTIAGASGAPGVDPAKGDIAGQISAYFKSRGVSDQETPYWVSKWAEFGAKDPAYFNQRLAAADIFGTGAGAPKAGTIAAAGMTAPAMTAPAATTPIPTPYQPGTIGAYGRRL